MEKLISLDNVSFKYENTDVLSDININIAGGESVAIIGSNGCGKSTLLKILCGILFPSKGTYKYDDETINERKMKDSVFAKNFHKKNGFIFQNTDAQLFCPTVYEEIAYGPLQMNLPSETVELRVQDSMEFLNIGHLAESKPYHLSEGEKKKVAIASVLSVNPDILILDEPMNNLDPRTKNSIREFLIKFNQIGKTVICVTHDLHYAEGVFGRAIVLSESHSVCADDGWNNIMNNKELLRKNNVI